MTFVSGNAWERLSWPSWARSSREISSRSFDSTDRFVAMGRLPTALVCLDRPAGASGADHTPARMDGILGRSIAVVILTDHAGRNVWEPRPSGTPPSLAW